MQKHYLIILALFCMVPAIASAASLRLQDAPSSVHVGDTFIVTLLLDSTDAALNAFEGSLHFSPSLMLQDIRFTGSLVPLWVEKPEQKETGTVIFAGVFPGGFQEKGKLFTLVFKAQSVGSADLSFGSETKAYKDDGKGTPVSLKTPTLSFAVVASSGAPREVILPTDTTPPEPFVPVVVSGQAFGWEGPALVFDTEDKDSGILHFEIARSYNPQAQEKDLSWQVVQSPYALSAQDFGRYLFVRATDRAQHTYTAVVSPQKISIALLVRQQWFVILLLLGIACSVILFFRRGNHRHDSV